MIKKDASLIVFYALLHLRNPRLNRRSPSIHKILPEHWRKGYAFESANRIVEFAFQEKQARQLFAGHHPNNKASNGLLIKLGFVYIRDEYFKPTGLNHPSYILERPNNPVIPSDLPEF